MAEFGNLMMMMMKLSLSAMLWMVAQACVPALAQRICSAGYVEQAEHHPERRAAQQ
jgi:hypothetical protein